MFYIAGGAWIGTIIWYVSGFFLPPQLKFSAGYIHSSIYLTVAGAMVGAIIWLLVSLILSRYSIIYFEFMFEDLIRDSWSGDWFDDYRTRSILRRERQLIRQGRRPPVFFNPVRPVDTRQAVARVAAENRAKGLLYQLLTPAERKQFNSGGQITIPGPACTYVLSQTGIRVIRYGKDVGGLCSVSSEELPASDLMIGRLLHLKFNQRAFTTEIARPC